MALTGAAFWQLADFTNIGLKSAYREVGVMCGSLVGPTVQVRQVLQYVSERKGFWPRKQSLETTRTIDL